MGYIIAGKYNVVLVCFTLKQNMSILSLLSNPIMDVSLYQIKCMDICRDLHFVKVFSYGWSCFTFIFSITYWLHYTSYNNYRHIFFMLVSCKHEALHINILVFDMIDFIFVYYLNCVHLLTFYSQ